MSEELEKKAVEVIDKAMDGMDKLSVMLGEVAEKYGPEVVDVGLEVARISAANELVVALVIFLVWLGILRTFFKLYKIEKASENGFNQPTIAAITCIGVGIISVIGVVPVLIESLPRLFSLWNWVGLIEPKLWIAHQVLNW